MFRLFLACLGRWSRRAAECPPFLELRAENCQVLCRPLPTSGVGDGDDGDGNGDENSENGDESGLCGSPAGKWETPLSGGTYLHSGRCDFECTGQPIVRRR